MIDAYSAARQAASGAGTGGRPLAIPKIKTGIVASIRMLKDRTRAYSQLRDLVTTAPPVVHDALIGLTGNQRAARAAAYRPDPARLTDPVQAAKRSLRNLARRIHELDAEIAEADRDLARLTKHAVPSLLAMRQVGPQTAAQMVITAGQNIDRMRSEAHFAKLCSVSPLPASSGKSGTRLNRGGRTSPRRTTRPPSSI